MCLTWMKRNYTWRAAKGGFEDVSRRQCTTMAVGRMIARRLGSHICHGAGRIAAAGNNLSRPFKDVAEASRSGDFWRSFSRASGQLRMVCLENRDEGGLRRLMSTDAGGKGSDHKATTVEEPGSAADEGTSTSEEASSEADSAKSFGTASSSSEQGASTKKERVVDDKTRTLQAALTYVAVESLGSRLKDVRLSGVYVLHIQPRLGWTEAAIAEGARDIGLSPSIVGAFPRKEAELVEFFMEECYRKLVNEAESQEDELCKMLLRDRLATLIRMRLEMQAPYVTKWPQALSIQAYPANVPTSLKQRAVLIDEIWHLAGDKSTNADWYTKRGLLAGVYSMSEIYMLTDFSPGFRDTWAFTEKRIKDVVDCGKAAQEAGHLAKAVGVGLANTVQSYLKRLSRAGF